MEHLSYKWLEEPEKFYPEPKTLVNVIKWHIAIKRISAKLSHEVNKDAYDEYRIACLSDIKTTPEMKALRSRDIEFGSSLEYEIVARIEAAMMIGRELWYKKRNVGYTDYDEELSKYKLSDLDAWMKVFAIPPSIAAGGNIEAATEYTLGKRADFLQTYIDSLEGSE